MRCLCLPINPMNYPSNMISLLLAKAFNKAKLESIHSNYGLLSEKITKALPEDPIITSDFLYRSLFLRINQLGGEKTERLRNVRDVLSKRFPNVGKQNGVLKTES